MKLRNRARRTKASSGIASVTESVTRQFEATSPNSAVAHFLRQIAREVSEATDREYSHREIERLTAQLLVHARVFWSQSDTALHRAASRVDIFPTSATAFGKLLRSGTLGGTDQAAEPEWRLVEDCLTSIELPAAKIPREKGNGSKTDSDYDVWLGRHQPLWRSEFGIYYTPRPIAAHIVRNVDSILRHEFGLADGLADTATWQDMMNRHPGLIPPAGTSPDTPFVQILDPAVGGGIFLVEVIEFVHQTLQRKWDQSGWTIERQQAAWNEYVPLHLLPRVAGLELLLPQLVMAWLSLAEALAITGYDFHIAPQIKLYLADTLAGTEPFDREVRCPFTVLIGNPPFSALTHVTNAWIGALLRRTNVGERTLSSFYEVDGEPLGEKKLWLHDDYVKFLRYAQWQIERTQCGVVSFVTNHGYLDNLTFRGMRQSLLSTFPQISLVDLHGNRKKQEVSPDGVRDENVFGIDQGVAIGCFSKPPRTTNPSIQYSELWGSRESKFAAMEHGTGTVTSHDVTPRAPYYFFSPDTTSVDRRQEYESGFPLNAIMPIHSSAAVTARDHFVVGFTRQELSDRLAAFGNRALGDEEIRERYFQRTRSRRYRTGDTRGWKLSAARQRAFESGDGAELIRTVQYRPFDRRMIVWADWLVDWPRSQVMRHQLEIDNLALVSRRQMLPRQPCNFFFITDTIVVDGLLRSDNRGNESFFPLYANAHHDADEAHPVRHNFSDEFIGSCLRQCPLHWLPFGRGDLISSIGPADVLGMIYAQFFATSYRERYADLLRLGFPRVFIPRELSLLQSLCRIGRELISLHLLREEMPERHAGPICGAAIPVVPAGDTAATQKHELAITRRNRSADFCDDGAVIIAGKYPCFDSETIHLSPNCRVESVPVEVWQYRIGAHQVCRKWLRDRRGRAIVAHDFETFRSIVRTIDRTIRCSGAIDLDIANAGGWPNAFVGQTRGGSG